MLMLQTIGKISGSKLRGITSVVALNFTSNKDRPVYPQDPLDLPEKQPFYEHKINYNFEQNKKYSKELKEVLEAKKKEEEVELKIRNNELKLVPRRRRRIYSTPRVDDDISKYSAWRSFDRDFPKLQQHSLPVVTKITVAPKFLVKAFGEGRIAYRNRYATYEYDFEDANLDQFLIYDYKQTTAYWGANLPGYNYEDQSTITPRKRIQKYPTPEEFWESEEEVMFRVNCSDYADFRKFKKYIVTKVNQAKNSAVESYKDKVIKDHGPLETYDDYSANYNMVSDPAIFKYNRSWYLEKGEKHDAVTPYHTPFQPAKKLDDKHRIRKDEKSEAPVKTAAK